MDTYKRDKEAIEKKTLVKKWLIWYNPKPKTRGNKKRCSHCRQEETGTIEFDKLDIEKSVEDLNRVLVEENSKTLFIEDSVNEVRELHKMSGRFDRFLNLIAITQN